MVSSSCIFLITAAVEEPLSQLETGPGSKVKVPALGEELHMALLLPAALEGTGRLSKVCGLTGSDWRESEV